MTTKAISRIGRARAGWAAAFAGAATAAWALGAAAAEPAPTAAQASAAKAPAAQASAALALQDFLDDPTWSHAQLSPSGSMLAIVKTENGADALEVFDLKAMKAKILLNTKPAGERERKAKVRQQVSYVHWKTDGRLVASVDTPADFADQIVLVPVHFVLTPDGATKPVSINEKNPGKRSSSVDLSEILDVLGQDPDHVLMSFERTLGQVEVDKVDLRDGSHTVVERAADNVYAYFTDRQGNIVTRYVQHLDGSYTVQGRAPGETRWSKLFDISRRTVKELSDYEILDFGGPAVLYVKVKPKTPDDGDTKVVRTYNLKTLSFGPVVWSNPKYDVDDVVVDEFSGELLAGCYWADVYTCDFKDPELAANMKGLSKYFEGARNIGVTSKSKDGSKWLLHISGPDEPGTYVLYDLSDHHVETIGTRWPKLTPDSLGRMRRLDYKARDGVQLSAYVTEPPNAGAGPLPLVVMPHGGPEVRDSFTYDEWAQFLATRGYVVLQPNFRGSDGFGRKFAEAGYRQWGARMHQDVMDAANALIASGRIDPNRVCIVGASYGGYEALWSAATEQKFYKCAVSVDGVSDLKTALNWERRFGTDSSTFKYWVKAIGDPAVDADKLAAQSPVTYAKSWTVPLLLIHGDKDEIVDVAQSRIMKRALEAEHKPVRYIEIKKMGHGPGTDEETTKVLTEIDAFLAPYLRPAPAPAVVQTAAAPAR